MGWVEKSVDDLPSFPRLDAQECMKRAVCEAHHQPKKYGLTGLVLQLFFPYVFASLLVCMTCCCLTTLLSIVSISINFFFFSLTGRTRRRTSLPESFPSINSQHDMEEGMRQIALLNTMVVWSTF